MDLNEMLKRLKNDPEYQERMREKEENRTRQVSLLHEAERPILEALKSVGIDIHSIYDLVNTSKPYIPALPILLEHFKRAYPDEIREGIARALAVREAKFCWAELSEMYKREPKSGAKDGLAVALSGIAVAEHLPELVELISDKQNGPSRIIFIRNLSRSKDNRALRALIELKDDPELKTEIQLTLKRKKAI